MSQVLCTFGNGSKTSVLVSDTTWTGTLGPILDSSVYNGEVCVAVFVCMLESDVACVQTYDARLEQEGWSTPGFTNASNWSPVPAVCVRPCAYV